MQSPDPEIKKMAEETVKSSNAQINNLIEMRKNFFENLDKGWFCSLCRGNKEAYSQNLPLNNATFIVSQVAIYTTVRD